MILINQCCDGAALRFSESLECSVYNVTFLIIRQSFPMSKICFAVISVSLANRQVGTRNFVDTHAEAR